MIIFIKIKKLNLYFQKTFYLLLKMFAHNYLKYTEYQPIIMLQFGFTIYLIAINEYRCIAAQRLQCYPFIILICNQCMLLLNTQTVKLNIGRRF
jgi:hypothetical protein